jgi:hypothetical protein
LDTSATAQEIVANYPGLKLEDVNAAVAYAARLARDEIVALKPVGMTLLVYTTRVWLGSRTHAY